MSRGKEQSPLNQSKRPHKHNSNDLHSPSSLRHPHAKEKKNTDTHQNKTENLKTNITQTPPATKEVIQTKKNISVYTDNFLYKNKKIILATIVLILVSIYLSTWQADIKHLPSFSDFTSNYYSLSRDEGRPGIYMKERGYKSHFPIVLLPGTVSTGLEVWEGSDCAHRYFRQRMWGHVTMLQSLVLDKNCWMNHVRLDDQTFMDPPGVKLRPAQGLEAADYLMPGYWVWGKMIENLADIGYDNNNLYMASYDWRLAFPHLQSRDHYFDKLKAMIETASRTNSNRKVVLISHSMGASLLLFFQNWVELQEPGWVDKWLEASINVGPSWLGSAKAIAILASGEMRDTAQLGYLEAALVDTFFSQKERTDLFRTWGSIASLLPKGGLPIWGHLNSAPDDVEYEGEGEEDLKKPSFGRMLSFPAASGLNNLTSVDVLEHLANLTGPMFKKVILEDAYSFGIASEKDLNDKNSDYHKLPKYWANPLESQLPNAPNYKIYSLYGVGKSTERAYYYKNSSGSSAESTVFGSASLRALYKALGYSQSQIPIQKAVDSEVQDFQEDSPEDSLSDNFESENKNNISEDSPEDAPTTRFVIDKTVNDPRLLLEFGVQNAEGDGTIPLMSLGYMCVEGWVKHKRFNPWNVSCINREYQHIPLSLLQDIRGGPYTADHVDIMGNYHLNEDVIRIVSGKQDEVEERILSPIREFSAKVKIPS